MSKKFWNKLITDAYQQDTAKLMRLAGREKAHDIFFGKQNLKWGLIGAYEIKGFVYNNSHSSDFEKAAKIFVDEAKKFCQSKKKLCAVTKYSDGFVATIFPRRGQAQTGMHAKAATYVDPTATDPYKGAMAIGWKKATAHLSTKFKAKGKKGEIDFLHADDPSAATMGPTNKDSDPRSQGVYNKKTKKLDKRKIGGRKTTIGTLYAEAQFGQGDMQKQADKKMSEMYIEEYDTNARLSDIGGRQRDILQEKLEELQNLTSIPDKTLKLFTQRAEKAILKNITTDLGWKVTRSKGGAKGRLYQIVIDGSVGAAKEQPKQYPWDLPIRQGVYKRTGIEGRLNDILEKEVVKILKKLPKGHKASDIEASETLGEIMDSDLVGASLDTIKKHFKGGKNVKVRVTRKTKKVKDKRATKDKIKIKQKISAKGRVTQGSSPKKVTGKIPIAKSTGKPDRRYKGTSLPGHSPIALVQLLNKALPDELHKKMTGVYPRSLEWRTGRFAESARVTNIVPFPNLTQISYTYMKDPYQVFEDQGGRDPKAIIGGTIRQLAQSIMGTRFGLVRTKRV